MSRKKNQKIRDLTKNKSYGIEFEEDPNPNDLLKEFLDEVEPNLAEAEVFDNDTKGQKHQKRKISITEKVTIDLHHLNADQAVAKVDQVFASFNGCGKKIEFLIITGKGLHSGPDGSVLPRHIHSHINSKYKHQIGTIEKSPADKTINGIPIKGTFKVTLNY